MQRRTYDTALKHLVRLNLQNGIPEELLSTIPRTNLHRWLHEDPDKYEGYALNEMAKNQLEFIRQFSEDRIAKKRIQHTSEFWQPAGLS